MLATYKNNRLVPAIIIAVCFALFYCLVDPSVENYGYKGAPSRTFVVDDDDAEDIGHHAGNNIQAPSSSITVATPSSDGSSGSSNVNQGKTAEETETPHHHESASDSGLSTDNILLMVKTGGTTVWKRLLVHLATSLSHTRIPPSNTVIYSDLPGQIGPFAIVDVLANMSSAAKSRPDLDVYRQQPEYAAHNRYVEAAGVAGDEWGPVGGWIVDKYKFVPLVQHAGRNWPAARWYVYMEDDAYLFLPNVLAYLSRFDWRAPHYLGSFAAKSNVVFAHGGAGFALSRGAWEASFGRNARMADDYYEYTAAHCCGDQVLAHALRQYGVKFGENGGDGRFTWGFNPVVHWSFAFSRYNWCSPLLSWHKVHSRDVAQYYELEKSWDFSKGPLLHRDFFEAMILPGIQRRAEWWDNLSSMYEVTSANKEAPPAPADAGLYDSGLWRKAWQSVDACEAACGGWAACAQWIYVEDLCKMDDRMMMGQGYAPAMSERKTALMQTSGWLHERLAQWTC